MKLLRSFLRLDWRRRSLVLQTLGWLLVFRTALAWVPLASLRRWARPAARFAGVGFSDQEVRWAILAIARRLAGSTCLVRALAMQALLSRSGRDTELTIGVAKDHAGQFAAHAWLACDGQPVIPGEETGRYALLPLPRA